MTLSVVNLLRMLDVFRHVVNVCERDVVDGRHGTFAVIVENDGSVGVVKLF